jgi:hypothetical protein
MSLRYLALLIIATLLVVFAIMSLAQSRDDSAQERLERTEHLADRHKQARLEFQLKSAMSAAPAGVSKDATIVDFSMRTDGEVLQKGTNQWTCMPEDVRPRESSSPLDDGPICMDKNATQWRKAWKSHIVPTISGPGLIYVLDGGFTASYADPFATARSGARSVHEPSHVMLVGVKFDHGVYSSSPKPNEPWIMWAGTPYECLIIPSK